MTYDKIQDTYFDTCLVRYKDGSTSNYKIVTLPVHSLFIFYLHLGTILRYFTVKWRHETEVLWVSRSD